MKKYSGKGVQPHNIILNIGVYITSENLQFLCRNFQWWGDSGAIELQSCRIHKHLL